MNSKCVKVGLFSTNCYIVEDKDFLAVIDPGSDLPLICDALCSKVPTHIILTHTHFDHVGALKALHEKFPLCKIAVGENENMDPVQVLQEAEYVLGPSFYMAGIDKKSFDMPKADILLKDGDIIGPFKVLSTPGHSAGSICLLNEKEKIMFSGDTLFAHGYGRTDINGSQRKLLDSLKRLRKEIDPDTIIYPGHESSSTLGLAFAF